jgi:phosphoribosylglycinamide formyltransferase-1
LHGKAEVAYVIASRPEALALERAYKHGIQAMYIGVRQFVTPAAHSEQMIIELRHRNVELVCLAGYMRKLEKSFIDAFRGRIINIHPALLPKFGGEGMYGHFVHEAVINAHETESGATVHWVNEEYDSGAAIIQEKVPVLANDTPEELAKRVLVVEHKIYPEAIAQIIEQLGGIKN